MRKITLSPVSPSCLRGWITGGLIADLGSVRSVVLQDGHGYLATMADGVILGFRRRERAQCDGLCASGV
jgi:hypothetical protein